MTDLHALPGPPAAGFPASGNTPAPAPAPAPPARPRPAGVLRGVSCWVVLAVLFALGVADVIVAALLPAPSTGTGGYELAAALNAARQQEVGHVDCGEHEHDGRRGENGEECRPHVAGEVVLE